MKPFSRSYWRYRPTSFCRIQQNRLYDNRDEWVPLYFHPFDSTGPYIGHVYQRRRIPAPFQSAFDYLKQQHPLSFEEELVRYRRLSRFFHDKNAPDRRHRDRSRSPLSPIRRCMASLDLNPVHCERVRHLDERNYVTNPMPFSCPRCFEWTEPRRGIVLRICFHSFCVDCVIETIHEATTAEIRCPHLTMEGEQCDSVFLDREIRSLVSPEQYERYLARSLRGNRTRLGDTFYCKTAGCEGWCVRPMPGIKANFCCAICKQKNCMKCEAIHEGKTCAEWRAQQADEATARMMRMTLNQTR